MIAQYFGFSENPFNPTPDPRYLFLTESHHEALASMVYGITERKGFVCITGEIGTGKTTLIRHLLNTLDPNVKTVFIYQTLVSFEELLKELLLELELPLGDGSKTQLIRQLNSYLIECFARNETVVVVVDEAQHLDKDVLEGLRLLSNLETERCKLIQIVLVGQPELEEKLNAEDLRQLRQRIGIWRRLKPLAEQESRDYIQHRLTKVGSSLENVFTLDSQSLICQYAKGVPRTINTLCDNSLLIGYALSKKKIDGDIVKEVLGDMGMLSVGKETDRNIRQELPPQGENLGLFTHADHFEITRVSESVLGPTASGRREPSVGRGTKEVFAKTFSNRAFKYRGTVVLGLLIMSLAGTGFLARGDLHHLSEKTAPVPSPSLSVQVNRSGGGEHEPRIWRTIIVERGETISLLAQRYYGIANLTVMDHILTVNQEITNPHRIRGGQTLILPEITEDSVVIQTGDGTYRIWLETFSNSREAESLKKEFSSTAKIELLPRPVSSNETWCRATTGFFVTRSECLKAIKALRTKGLLSALKR